ncbi:hypothetical protein GCM10020006_04310 [Fructilactobacillus sanfranciscensis]
MSPTIIGVVLKCFLLSITIFSNFIFILIVIFILDVTGIRTIRQGGCKLIPETTFKRGYNE